MALINNKLQFIFNCNLRKLAKASGPVVFMVLLVNAILVSVFYLIPLLVSTFVGLPLFSWGIRAENKHLTHYMAIMVGGILSLPYLLNFALVYVVLCLVKSMVVAGSMVADFSIFIFQAVRDLCSNRSSTPQSGATAENLDPLPQKEAAPLPPPPASKLFSAASPPVTTAAPINNNID